MEIERESVRIQKLFVNNRNETATDSVVQNYRLNHQACNRKFELEIRSAEQGTS